MNTTIRNSLLAMAVVGALSLTACQTTDDPMDAPEPTPMDDTAPPVDETMPTTDPTTTPTDATSDGADGSGF